MQTKGLIITLGFSTDPLVFTIDKLKPEKVVFIATKDSISKALDEVIERTSLKPSQYKAIDIADSPEMIGSLITKFMEGFNWLRSFGYSNDQIEVDPTGATKWMSSGTIMIASFLGLRMCYVFAEYLQGRPVSGTMKIIPLGNAYDQTGFIVAENARKLFNNCFFESAEEHFSSIRPTDSKMAEFFKGMAKLSRSISRWDRFEHYNDVISPDLDEALELIGRSLKSNYSSTELHEFLESMKSFNEIMKSLESTKTINEAFIVDIFFNAKRRFSVKRYDDCMARLYRTLEAIGQFLLKTKLNQDASTMNWSLIAVDKKDKYQKWSKDTTFPDKIDLLKIYILLYTHDIHEVSALFTISKGNSLSFKLLGLLEKRNQSILAHGFRPVSAKEANEMIQVLEELIRSSIPDYERLTKVFELPRLPEFSSIN